MSTEDWLNLIPIKLPVEWEYVGDAGLHPNLPNVSGRGVVIIIQKKFTKFEKLLAKLLKAPRTVRRTMHHTQSMLWELIDGERNVQQICKIMDDLYHEDIAPVNERVKAYLEVFIGLNVISLFRVKEEE